MKRKVKYKNFDHTLTVALLGDYSQNVPKSKCTFVESKFTQVRSKLTQVESNVPIVYLYNLICVQINRNYVFIILKIFNSAFFFNLPYMIKTNDTTYNIAKSVKCLVIKSRKIKLLLTKKKKKNGYLKIFIHHYKNMFLYVKKTKHQHI